MVRYFCLQYLARSETFDLEDVREEGRTWLSTNVTLVAETGSAAEQLTRALCVANVPALVELELAGPTRKLAELMKTEEFRGYLESRLQYPVLRDPKLVVEFLSLTEKAEHGIVSPLLI